MTACIHPKELRSNWAPWGIPKCEPASSREGSPDLPICGPMKPGGAGGSCLHTMVNFELPASSGSDASSGQLGAGMAVGHSSWGSGSSSGDLVSSTGLGEVIVSSSTTSNMDRLNRSPLSMRGTRQLCRSWMAWQSTPGGVPDCMAHCWRALAKATMSLHLTTWMYLGPWIPVGNKGRKSPHLKPVRLGGAFHKPYFSFLASGNWKAAACLLSSFCILASLRGLVLLWYRDQRSHHQLGSTFLCSKYALTQTLVLLGSRVDGYLNPSLHWALLVFQVWSLLVLDTADKGVYSEHQPTQLILLVQQLLDI